MEPVRLFGMALLIVLGAGLFAASSLIVTCSLKTRARFMGIRQVEPMPTFKQCDLPTGYHLGLASRCGSAEPAHLAVLASVFAVLAAVAARLSGRMGT